MLICSVPAGVYPIGHDSYPTSRPVHTVLLATFAIGQTAVTNGQFASFIADGGYTTPSLWTTMGWRWQKSKNVSEPAFWRDPNFNRPQQPVVGVTWYESVAFANWLSRETGEAWRLPTETEWEAAARGTDDYPLPDTGLINSAERGLGCTSPSYEGNISWCGAVNLLGNVWEWVGSRWGRNWQNLDYPYPYKADDGREDLRGSHARVMRGGSWFDRLVEAHPANRGRFLPGSRASNIGFRLARS
jgi:formylglycine-generating enzyme required for sulfatase activity